MAKRRRRKRAISPRKINFPQAVLDSSQSYHEGPLRIRLYGDPVLREKALPVQEITDIERKFAKDMLAMMYDVPNGVGLAAPQVGLLKRLIVIDVSREDLASHPLVLFNPEIRNLEGEAIEEEGCLSLPDITAEVKRAAKALVTAQDIDGQSICIEGNGLLARVLQHEIDHLDGILFIDHVSRLKRQLLRGKLRKLKQQSQQ